jgi:hypothetical protein
MEYKIKKTLAIIFACLLAFIIFSSVMVYAPPPENVGNPFQRVIITNTDPVPVSIKDEPIEVTGLVGLSYHEPFQYTDYFLIEEDRRGAVEIEVPEDSILVLEHISISCFGASGDQNILCSLNSKLYLGVTSYDSVIIGPFDKLNDYNYFKTMGIKMYHDSEDILELEVNLSTSDYVIIRFTISGYLIDTS